MGEGRMRDFLLTISAFCSTARLASTLNSLIHKPPRLAYAPLMKARLHLQLLFTDSHPPDFVFPLCLAPVNCLSPYESKSPHRKCFTLIELLVGDRHHWHLAALLLPALSKAKPALIRRLAKPPAPNRRRAANIRQRSWKCISYLIDHDDISTRVQDVNGGDANWWAKWPRIIQSNGQMRPTLSRYRGWLRAAMSRHPHGTWLSEVTHTMVSVVFKAGWARS